MVGIVPNTVRIVPNMVGIAPNMVGIVPNMGGVVPNMVGMVPSMVEAATIMVGLVPRATHPVAHIRGMAGVCMPQQVPSSSCARASCGPLSVRPMDVLARVCAGVCVRSAAKLGQVAKRVGTLGVQGRGM